MANLSCRGFAGHDFLTGHLWLLRVGFRPVQHNNVTYLHDEMAAGFFCELGREFLFLLFPFVKLHFEQFVMLKRVIESGQEGRAKALFADLQHGFEPLCPSFEFADLGIRQ